MSRYRSEREEGETSDADQGVDWQAKYRQMEARLKEAEAQNLKAISVNTPNRNNTSVSTDSTTGQSVGNTIVNVNTHTDQRIFQVITAKKMSARSFEEMIPLVQEGQKLSHYCDREAEDLIYVHLNTMGIMDAEFKVDKDSKLTEIFEAMKKYYKSDLLLSSAAETAKDTFWEWPKDPKNTRLDSVDSFQQYSVKLVQLQQKIENERLPQDQIANVIKTIKNNLGKSSRPGVKVVAVEAIKNKFDVIEKTTQAPTSIKEFQAQLGAYRFECLEAIKMCEEMGILHAKRGAGGESNRESNKRGRGNNYERDRNRQFEPKPQRRLCFICNIGKHAEGDCRFFDHPDGNHENKPFEDSTKGKLWIAKGYYKLSTTSCLDGSEWVNNSPQDNNTSHSSAGRGHHGSYRGGGRGFYRGGGGRRGSPFRREYNYFNKNANNKRTREIDNDNIQESLNAIKNKSNSLDESLAILQILPQVAMEEAEEVEDSNRITVSTLFDSGATSKNYISTQIAQELELKGAKLCDCDKLVCSSLGDQPICKKSQGTMKCTIIYKDEKEKEYKDNIEATIIESSLDLILGRETIKDLNIVDKFPSHFKHFKPNKDNEMNEKETASDFENEECTPSNRYPKSDTHSVESLNVLIQRDNILNEIRLSKEERDYDGIDENELSVFPWHQFEPTPTSQTMPNYHGDNENFNKALKATCEEYSCVFSTQISKEPARIPPMKLEVDEEMWSRCNKPMRELSEVKKSALRDHLSNLTEHGIIQPSAATSWSHPHLPPKPDGSYRFTCDFRELNAATKPRNNFIPNIEEMIRRIGYKKPKYFGTLDLTNGYWQIALDKESMKYTAFICAFGILEFCRLAMGLKNAAGYFQSMLAALVLVNLIYYMSSLSCPL